MRVSAETLHAIASPSTPQFCGQAKAVTTSNPCGRLAVESVDAVQLAVVEGLEGEPT
jgi:hypothetical protein